jgi:hypothetical protein
MRPNSKVIGCSLARRKERSEVLKGCQPGRASGIELETMIGIYLEV